ncbi:hypothetical protein B5F53_18500 [Blautia sp. An249]|uniref:hypothetical protein n=1 Tax=Blautia sp. An249 TaxID=1965603 RepID=UPI000B3691F9|nr:hypothetical protein [Blautia sp. An249]OUO75181.1 hypothetical protein B5F53_18500 [Blautia sp. An249]
MAIQSRNGDYGHFDPRKLLPAELAVVLKDDPSAKDGKSVYICFKAGDVKRMATYEDMVSNMDQSLEEIKSVFSKDMVDLMGDIQEKLDNGDFDGAAATIKIGTVTTGEPGTQAKVTNVGTSRDAVLNFVFPRGATGEIENLDTATVNFTQASTRSNILATDTMKTILGKIKKFFADLKTVAFSGSYNDLTNKPTLFSGNYNDLTNKPTIPSILNNLTSTSTSSGLSAAMGKQLADNQGNLSDLDTDGKDNLVEAINEEHARIQSGKTGVINASGKENIPDQSYAIVQITFPKAFPSIPNVVAGIVCPAESKNANYGGLTATVEEGSVTKTGFNLRVFNDSGSGCQPRASWIASI